MEIPQDNNEEEKPEKKSVFSSLLKRKKIRDRKEFNEMIPKLDLEKDLIAPLLDAAEGWESWNWEFVCEDKGITITRTSIPNSVLKCTKGVAVFKATPKEILDIVSNVDYYKQWDPKILESKSIYTVNSTTSTNYFEFAPFFPVAGRDVCFLQHIKREKDGSIIVSWHSIKDPEVPKKKGVVRAAMGTSGFVITPLKTTIPLSCLVTFVVQFDLKGWIPPTLMNSITSGQPMILYFIGEELQKQRAQKGIKSDAPISDSPRPPRSVNTEQATQTQTIQTPSVDVTVKEGETEESST